MTPPRSREASHRRFSWALQIKSWELDEYGWGRNFGQREQDMQQPKGVKELSLFRDHRYSRDGTKKGGCPGKARARQEWQDVVGLKRTRGATHEGSWLPRWRVCLHQKSSGTPLRILSRGVTWLDLHFRDHSSKSVEGELEAGPD